MRQHKRRKNWALGLANLNNGPFQSLSHSLHLFFPMHEWFFFRLWIHKFHNLLLIISLPANILYQFKFFIKNVPS
jgi:hypothetical protein